MSRKGENIFKRKDGRWEARYIHHYENGIAKYRYVYGATYMEAKRKRSEDQCIFGTNTKKSKSTNCTFKILSNEWLKSIEHTVKESTYARYVRIVERYLCPNFANNPNALLTVTPINELVTHLPYIGHSSQTVTAPLLLICKPNFFYNIFIPPCFL